MWDDATRRRLEANWGEWADALDCRAEVRVYDPLSSWETYVFAQNPCENDTILCLLQHSSGYVVLDSVESLQSRYNSAGEPPVIDREYRPRDAREILKQWREYDPIRD